MSAEFDTQFRAARDLHAAGKLAEAERAYRRLADGDQRETVLNALVDLYVQAQRPQQAIETLALLAKDAPESLFHCARLATLLQSVGLIDVAIGHYRHFLAHNPDNANAYYNLALVLKSDLRFPEAVESYEKAIELGIENAHEVYSNLGVLLSDMRRTSEARALYERALAAAPDFVPAMFNLAGLCEESGEREQAIALYEKILAADPNHSEALARLAQAADASEASVAKLRAAVEKTSDDGARESLLFASGKVLDALGRFEEAFDAYSQANALSRKRSAPYDRAVTERAFDELMQVFSRDWIERCTTTSDAQPIFVCGMFRSGSTLVERMLGAHPSVTAAGELDFLPWLVVRRLAPYPGAAANLDAQTLAKLGDEYCARIREFFPAAAHVTDKRPDNFLHLGLVRAMFPKARIVHTRRDRADNSLSIFFQQLGGQLAYASNLDDAAHYHAQHDRLMEHWRSLFADNLFTVDYDELVRGPEPILRALIDFLGLEWDDACLDFQRGGGAVKTASVWQVRGELSTASSGRFENYREFIGHDL